MVPVKRVIDPIVKIQVKQDGSGVVTEQVKMVMNPFDEIALEEAVLQQEKGQLGEIIAVSIGPIGTEEILRNALARGADRAIWITQETPLESYNIAKILNRIVVEESITLVLMGKQAVDSDCNQTGQMLAGLLGWSQGTNVSKVIINSNHTLTVVRETDTGSETLNLTLPAVVTADLRLNEPRYLALPNVMKAKKKPLVQQSLTQLGVDIREHLKVLKVESSIMQRRGTMVKDVKELVLKLKNEAHVL